MKRLYRTFLSVNKELNVALGVSILFYILVKVWQRNLPPIKGWGGVDLFTNLSLAYVASWIFFFIGEHRERTKQRSALMHTVGEEINELFIVLKSCLGLTARIETSDSRSLTEYFAFGENYYAERFKVIFDEVPNNESAKRRIGDLYSELVVIYEQSNAILEIRNHLDLSMSASITSIRDSAKRISDYLLRTSPDRHARNVDTFMIAGQTYVRGYILPSSVGRDFYSMLYEYIKMTIHLRIEYDDPAYAFYSEMGLFLKQIDKMFESGEVNPPNRKLL